MTTSVAVDMVDAAAVEFHGWTAAKATTSAALDLVDAAAVEFHDWTAAAKAKTSAALDLVDAAVVECHGWTAAKAKTSAAGDLEDAAAVECHSWTVPMMVAAVVERAKDGWTVTTSVQVATAASDVQLALAAFHSHRRCVVDGQGMKER